MRAKPICANIFLWLTAVTLHAFNPIEELDPSNPEELERAGIDISYLNFQVDEHPMISAFSVKVDPIESKECAELVVTVESPINGTVISHVSCSSKHFTDGSVNFSSQIPAANLTQSTLRIQKLRKNEKGTVVPAGGYIVSLKSVTEVAHLAALEKAKRTAATDETR